MSHAKRPAAHTAPLRTDCLREVRCSVVKQKRIALVHDSVRGGATLEVCRNEECPDELRGPVFDTRSVIEWHRIKVRHARQEHHVSHGLSDLL